MKTQRPKLKTQPRPFFSCGFFRHCAQTALSPTAPHSPSLPLSSSAPPPLPPSPPPPPASLTLVLPPQPQAQRPLLKAPQAESSSSSSSSASQSFTQWRFPLVISPLHQHSPPESLAQPKTDPRSESLSSVTQPLPPPIHSSELQEIFHVAELQLSSESESEKVAALHLLERSLVPNPPTEPVCPLEVMRGVVVNLKNKAGAKLATKILLALCLAEENRHVAVKAGTVGSVVEVAMELEGPTAERALAALELACTVEEGAAELRAHALAMPVMVAKMGEMEGRGKEYAISALSVIYGGGTPHEQVQHAPPEEVARAVVLALQGDCTARARRKGAQLLKALQDYGRLDSTLDGNEGL
ncbi:hypothetical protein P3X46_019859 [Hevea brasiliensis]|uniref:U-box domain-containing protein n=1 Tax=Hevea brasiliensis TaxID=3981 RepID=A0ABQ9LK25_HEVBR|nr:uncharacterized protein LOC110665624 [Hevea brasiliensis]KAJ9168316.1 hypothetical protein P3X46_019859 [Hevea brasiliensis]